MLVTFHFDPICPWTWMTSRWLLRAAATEGFDVAWAPLSLAHVNRDREVPQRFQAGMAVSTAAARLVQHLRAAGDDPATGRLYAAWGRRVHVEGASPSVDLLVDVATGAGLDERHVRSVVADESLDVEVGRATDAAVAAAGPDVGSPVITWVTDDGREVAMFGPILSDLPEPAVAAEQWRGVRALAGFSGFDELKRGTRAPLDLAATASP